ncbi:hypothetical protein HMPREF3202_01426 [Prevotella bivia]|uniref:Uncharacterized protein n=1 Tax=Prevotella bivia TaxID=28125 RepID=A0A137SVA0_9BACT|nr:hypothetical protein HMPREF3202_01426 [Prevotella bivia]
MWYQTQQRRSSFIWSSVVICLKISIFVVSNTTHICKLLYLLLL